MLQAVIEPLYAAHRVVKIERSQRNPLDLDLPERKLILDADGKLAGVRWPERLEAHRLIEEFVDPRQCRGGRDAGGCAFPVDLSRP